MKTYLYVFMGQEIATQQQQSLETKVAEYLGRNWKAFHPENDRDADKKQYYYNLSSAEQKKIREGLASAMGIPAEQAQMMAVQLVTVNGHENKELSVSLYSGNSRQLASVTYDLSKRKMVRVLDQKNLEIEDRDFNLKVEELRDGVIQLSSEQGVRLAAIAEKGKKETYKYSDSTTTVFQHSVTFSNPIGKIVIPKMIEAFKLNAKPEELSLTVIKSSTKDHLGVQSGYTHAMLEGPSKDSSGIPKQRTALVIEQYGSHSIIDFNVLGDQDRAALR